MPNTKKQEEVYCPYEDMTITNHFEAVIGKLILSKIPNTDKNKPFINAYKQLLALGIEVMATVVFEANVPKKFSWGDTSYSGREQSDIPAIINRRKILASFFNEDILDYKALEKFEIDFRHIWMNLFSMMQAMEVKSSDLEKLKKFSIIAFYRKAVADISRDCLKKSLKLVEKFFASSSISAPDPMLWWKSFLADVCHYYINYKMLASCAYQLENAIFGKKAHLIENTIFLKGEYCHKYKTTLSYIQKSLLEAILRDDDVCIHKILFITALEAFPGIAKTWVYQKYNVFVDEVVDNNLFDVIKEKREQILGNRLRKRSSPAVDYKTIAKKWRQDWKIPEAPSEIIFENSDGIKYCTKFKIYTDYKQTAPRANPHLCSRSSYWIDSFGKSTIATGGVSLYKICKSVLDGIWESPHLDTKDKIIHIEGLPDNFESDYKEYIERCNKISKRI